MSSNVLTFLFVRVILILSFAKMKSKRISWIRSFGWQWFTSTRAGMPTEIPPREGDTYIPACIFPKSELKCHWKRYCCLVWVGFFFFPTVLTYFIWHILLLTQEPWFGCGYVLWSEGFSVTVRNRVSSPVCAKSGVSCWSEPCHGSLEVPCFTWALRYKYFILSILVLE